MDSSLPGRVWSDERLCLLAALTIAALIVYGSLLPFDLSRPDALDPGAWLEQIQLTPWSRVQRPNAFVVDFLVNVAVGVPFGFSLMGALRSGRHRRKLGAAVAVLLVGGISAVLATAVELLQVLSPTRDSSWNDVLAQCLGGSVGALGWPLTGPALLLWLRRLANEREPTRFAARLLQLYLPIYLLVQLSPVDIPIGAAELAAKSREIQIPLVPFAYHLDSTVLDLRIFAGAGLFNVPIGMLAVLGWVGTAKHRRLGPAVLIGFSMVLTMELAQGFLWSRHSRMSDVVAGMLGVTIGVAVGARWAHLRVRGPSDRSLKFHPAFLFAAAAWTLVLMGQHWYPFDFQTTLGFANERLTEMPRIPFTAYHAYSADPLQGLQEVLRSFLLGIPLGMLLRMGLAVVRPAEPLPAPERRDDRPRNDRAAGS